MAVAAEVVNMVKSLVLTGYGINSEMETAYANRLAGADATIAHVNDVIDGLVKIEDYQILNFPGGFSYGDDLGSGKAFANKLLYAKTPDGHYKLAQLVRANKALYDYTTAFGTPCISGKDSMKNDYKL